MNTKKRICSNCGKEYDSPEPFIDIYDDMCLQCRMENQEVVAYYNKRY